MSAYIRDVQYYLPPDIISTATLASEFPELPISKLGEKLGIKSRHLAHSDEYVSDLATTAAEKLFSSGLCQRDEVDFLILCTQTPDYLVPTTACIVQHRLGLKTSVGSFDINLGCSGFVYGLGVANGLLASGQARGVLLVTADTYSRFIRSDDWSSRCIFGDGAAACLIAHDDCEEGAIGPFVYGTDGRGARDLIVPGSGMRPNEIATNSLVMNGERVFHFAVKQVCNAIRELMHNGHTRLENVDLFVLHQANAYLLSTIRDQLHIPREKFYISALDSGNTVSSTIPIALRNAWLEGRLTQNATVALVGFGVGFSWAACLIKWRLNDELLTPH